MSQPRIRWWDWAKALFPVVVFVAGVIWAGGKYSSQMDDNTRRIEALEIRTQQRDEKLEQIDTRTARIEGKLDLIVPQQSHQP